MPPRRSHAKSRRGCLNCKSRHIKCDEGGPPCDRCKLRGTACEYATPGSGAKTSAIAEVREEISHTAAKINELQFPADRRLLELQLMHRWSTLTHKSCSTPGAGDEEVWEQLVPTLSVRYDFLLNGLLALAAFDCARSAPQSTYEQYVNSAVEYHALALGTFRSHLPLINPESYEAALCLSLMLMILALASAQFTPKSATSKTPDMVQNAIVHFELLRGCVPIADINEDYLLSNPYIRNLKLFEDLPRTTIDERVREALTQLSDFNDRKIVSTVHESDERRMRQIAHWGACKKALAVLGELFEKCVDDFSLGYVLGFLNIAGEEYIKALKDEDNASLLILMFWGVLMDKLGHKVWWADQFGSLLVSEIASRILVHEDDKEINSIIFWAQRNLRASSPEQVDS
ncbi:uncharacterized protein A1O9_09410 [Exophiala aquamarina CBS 119918]|uniref:Zn(2)-C6 fungal-type domain-containing protein n=1 Tax=Exophiala aquamarina CBS 119918 TaxID=1182545 RepID=A0A072P2A0_9EURO|nr:uncharacterized protein A1O9_09410 [Exophiala aquamarina CBS 119918]KEF54244.1 hypothetical protein A1O9_09410 [Exophiala aquamarina CBS 119918]